METSNKSIPGWYEQDGGLRFHDGEHWTPFRVPKPPPTLTRNDISFAVFAGVFAALALVWLLAQLAPDTFYLPVKFVVKELPNY
jgi:hypothetical protein